MMVLTFIVIIIGGLGSVGGCFIGAVLVAMVANYAGFLAAQARAGLQHPADGRHPAVAAARPLPGDAPMMILSGDPPRGRVLTRSSWW